MAGVIPTIAGSNRGEQSQPRIRGCTTGYRGFLERPPHLALPSQDSQSITENQLSPARVATPKLDRSGALRWTFTDFVPGWLDVSGHDSRVVTFVVIKMDELG